MNTLLFQRLINRGHTHNKSSKIFSSAIKSIEAYENDPFIHPKKDTTGNRIFFHDPYHPTEISRHTSRDIYESTCKSNINFQHLLNIKIKSFMKIDDITVAYSRPKNLRDFLCPSTLQESEKIKVSNYAHK